MRSFPLFAVLLMLSCSAFAHTLTLDKPPDRPSLFMDDVGAESPTVSHEEARASEQALSCDALTALVFCHSEAIRPEIKGLPAQAMRLGLPIPEYEPERARARAGPSGFCRPLHRPPAVNRVDRFVRCRLSEQCL